MKRISLLISMLISLSIQAQELNKQKMDSLFSLIETENKGMGSIAIMHQGESVYEKAFGMAQVENQIKATPNTRYHIGSISKTFTATLIMQLIEEGQLTLQTPLSKFFPKIPNADSIHIEHLLRHQSGLFNFTSAEDYNQWMEQEMPHEKLLAKIRKYPIEFAPGTKTAYSNTNYVLLSFIAEQVSHESFASLLEERIIKTCGLKHTQFGTKATPEEALSYTYAKNWQISTKTHPTITMGAGGILSTSTDLNKFLTCLFAGKLVSASSLEKMKKMENGMGMGLFRFPFHDKYAYGHTGGIDGFLSVAGYFPEEKMALTYLSNGVVMPRNDILIGALSIYFNREYEMPEFKEPINLPLNTLKQYEGTYSSPGFPLSLKIFVKEEQLFGQGTNQPAFPLEAYEENKFRYDAAQLTIDFFPQENKLILYQGGGQFELKRASDSQ
ncbi:MAG: serine hydrolase domain-containing protein [Bacteroidota bacterium]